MDQYRATRHLNGPFGNGRALQPNSNRDETSDVKQGTVGRLQKDEEKNFYEYSFPASLLDLISKVSHSASVQSDDGIYESLITTHVSEAVLIA